MNGSFRRFRLILAVFVGLVAFPGDVALAQAPPLSEIVDLRLRSREAQGKSDVARWERDERGGNPDRNFDPPPALRRVMGQVYQSIHSLPTGTAPSVEPDPNLVAAWKAAQTRQLEFQKAVAEREAEYGFSWSERTPPRFRFGLLDGLIVLCGIVAFTVSCLLALHERRRSVRQRRRSRLPGGIAVSVALMLLGNSGCGGASARGETDRRVLEAEKQAAQDQLTAATTELHDLSQAREGLTQVRIDNWAKYVEPAALKTTVVERETELLNRIRATAERAAIEDRLAKDVAELASLEADEAELDAMTRSASWWLFAFAGVRVAVAVILAGIAFAPFWMARRWSSSEIKLSARTCPQCLAVGKLVVQKTPRGAGEYTESTFLECKAKDRDGVECGYRVARSHQYVPRLCFPTVGIRGGGKTHMLTTAYASIHNRVVPTSAAVQPAPSVMDEQFRQYIELILRHRGEAGGTIHDTAQVPPLLIHSRDTDRWGPTGVLVNLFDYSGELIEETPLAAALRERAMKMNGFMMIFDPTQIYGDVGGVTLEDQIRALANFYQQMAEARGLPPGTLIPNPVAVCITKYDLLETQNPIGGQCLPFIQHLDGALKPGDHSPVTLAMLKGRSDLVEQMLPLMFPGVDLGRLIREYFGNQMLYFPMSSVNLNLDEFGRVDTSDRNPAPYGVVEPILWLMHMHGYCVLEPT